MAARRCFLWGWLAGLGATAWLTAAATAAAAAAPDLHEHWDTRCKPCHGDAAVFARSTLSVDAQGRLLGRHHGDQLDTFLRQHYLGDDLVPPVMAMLKAQVVTTPVFKQKCAGCHESAAALARKSLVLRDGVLTGRSSGRPVAEFLRNHGGLAGAEVEPMVRTLERVLKEVGAASQAAALAGPH